jgi:selenocysteine lyase/cysteine desulfurase
VDATALRAEFPVLADRAYLNAGTCGPLPHAAVQASLDMLDRGASEGRAKEYVEAMIELRDRLRSAYAATLGADTTDVALTTCTSDGIVRVLAGLELGPGDEVLTAPDEHPGLLGPLTTLRARRGVDVRAVAFADLADAVGPRTRLVACSHVSWITGALRPEGLAALDVPVLLDGAQGVGAIGFDVTALGCAFYAGSGQKWLCGPIGSGMLWVAPAWHERLAPIGATYLNLEDANAGLDSRLHPDARRYDAPGVSAETLAAAVAAHDVLAARGWPAVHARAAALAASLAERLAAAGRTVAPRADTTLVSFEDPDPEATRDRLAEADVTVRHLPGTSYVRASVGAWNDEDDLERLLAAL